MLHWFSPLYGLSGLCVGFLVGMTGVGGGSLMTPLLILLFGIHPTTAVGTDLLYAAITKTGGSLVHGFFRTVDWTIVGRLAMGSIPAAALTIALMSQANLGGDSARIVINSVLSAGLVITACVLVFRRAIQAYYASHIGELSPERTRTVTVITGAVLGVLVSISSVGAGAIGVTALILLYPKLPIRRIVGSDIAHAVPLTLVGGIGHWMLGTLDWHILPSLLVGSLPGVLLGSRLSIRLPDTGLRYVLASVLIVVAGKLVF
ncbi:MAG TPA: sulfite exporter TauE/SafE family protein [Candidatus Udaeobacter sp.]|nr:sulfite exporter TauE/SafE family protein [Candidatus Udaeobacter sp.]